MNKELKKDIARTKRLSKSNPKRDTGYWLCLVDKHLANDWGAALGYPTMTEDSWGVFEPSQNGFKWAKEKYPYVYKKG